MALICEFGGLKLKQFSTDVERKKKTQTMLMTWEYEIYDVCTSLKAREILIWVPPQHNGYDSVHVYESRQK